MKRWVVFPVAVLFVTWAGVCDPGTVDVFPELEDRFSFEAGLEGWIVGASDLGEPPARWDVSVSSAESFDGAQSVALTLDNTSGSGRVFLRRRMELVPDTDYRAEVVFHLGTLDAGDIGLWNIIGVVSRDEPTNGAGFVILGDTGGGSGTAVEWVEKTATLDFSTGPDDGDAWIGLGIWGTSAFERLYYVDDVSLTVRRR